MNQLSLRCYRILIPKGPLVFGFSPWMIIFPLWAHSALSMANCCYIRITIAHSKESFWFKLKWYRPGLQRYLSQTSLLDMQSRVRKTLIKKLYFDFKTIFFLWTSHCEQGCSCVGKKKKKTRGLHSNQEKKQLTAKAAWIIFSEVHGELILIRDNSFNVHV